MLISSVERSIVHRLGPPLSFAPSLNLHQSNRPGSQSQAPAFPPAKFH